MKRIMFEQAITKDSCCIIKGYNVGRLIATESKHRFRLECIQNGVPMAFSKINTTVRRIIGDDLNYINFWKGIEIYKEV